MFPEAEYIAWAKAHHPKPGIHLCWSNVPAIPRDELEALGVDLARPDLTWGARGGDGGGPLRELVAARRGVTEDEVLLALGTTGANFAVLAANLADCGDAPIALVETPTYVPVVRTLEALGYRIAKFERPREDGWALDPERVARAWRRGVAVVVATSLHNPTGTAIGAAEQRAVAKLCASRGALFLSNEVYREFVEPSVAPTAPPGACSTQSVSKVFGLADLRIGWAIAPKPLIARARRILDHVSGDPPVPARDLAARALAKWDGLVARARAVAARGRALVDAAFTGRDDVRFSAPPGGVHGFVELLGEGEDADAFCARLLREEEVLVVPGSFFEAPYGFRIGWGGEPAKVERALASLVAALDRRATSSSATPTSARRPSPSRPAGRSRANPARRSDRRSSALRPSRRGRS